MTIGIYKITFSDGRSYVGQSNDLESRYVQHVNNLRKYKHCNYLMQKAFKELQEMPGLEILKVCSLEELNSEEQKYLDILFLSDKHLILNILDKVGPPVLRGHFNGNAKLLQYQYIEIMGLLTNPANSLTEIAEWYDVTVSLVQHIATGESHKWLKEVDEKKYYEMLSHNGHRNNCIAKGKKNYILRDPKGNIHKVTNLSALAREYGLLQPKLSEVLGGTRQHHKGWTKVE